MKFDNGPHLQKFFDNTHCVRSKFLARRIIQTDLESQNFDDKCTSLQDYETKIVIYKNHVIEKDLDGHCDETEEPQNQGPQNQDPPETIKPKIKFGPLSTIKAGYIDEIIKNLDDYLPENQLGLFEIFNNQKWGSQIPIRELKVTSEEKLKELCKLYGINYENTIFDSWISLLNQIEQETYPYCHIHESTPAR